MKLRPHQKQDYKECKTHFKELDHILMGGATGYGKSALLYHNVKKEIGAGGRVLVIAPRRKLVKQLTETLLDFYPSVIMGADTEYYKDANVFVASTATMHNKLKVHGGKYFGNITMVIIDEVHINFGSTSMSLVHKLYWDKSKWLGLSATPIDDAGYRLEGWDLTIYNYQTSDLINMGWLTPVRVLVEDKPQGLDDLKMTGGDYNEGDLADFMMDGARVSNIYSIYKKYARGRKVMVFAVTINHADMIYKEFVKKGVPVGVVHSNNPESEEEQILYDFSSGDIEVLINVGKLTTGFDETSVDCLILARPTKSLRLFIQIIGRGLRLHKGKDECLILDVAGVIKEHGYPTMKRDFNKVKPPPKEKQNIEYADSICDFCEYSTQFKNCKRKVKETKKFTRTRWYCPNCGEVMKEVLVDNKQVKKLFELKDYTNVDKVTNEMVGKMIYAIAKRNKYKRGWISYMSNDYIKCEGLSYDMKIQYNRWKAGLCNLDTVLRNINMSREQYCGN